MDIEPQTEEKAADAPEMTFMGFQLPAFQSPSIAHFPHNTNQPQTSEERTEWATGIWHARAEPLEWAEGEEVVGMINLVPGVDERDWILAKFDNHPDWTHRCIHFPTFISEVNCFYSRHFALLSPPGESFPQISVDLLWLALFFQILSNGIEAGLVKSRGLEGFSELSREEVQEKAKRWLAASQRCLVLGKYLEQPRIRTIQTIILFCRNLQTTGIPTYTATFALSLLGTAIRISQLLKLHRLGQNENRMPPDDPALPWGRNSLKRQTALRIFGIVCFLDWMSATTADRAYLINPCLVDSEPPMNVNDNSLSLMSSA
ncbi:hypothetical protein BT69DRAFT_654618 [Atractiella rhizophila]|nr:hypothetical protein BT69DRAFT_654618 [Atractiella rhizophila]